VKRFCSRACANAREHSDETKKKMSESSLGRKYTPTTKVKSCKVCNTEFELLWEHSRSTCSSECYSVYLGCKVKGKAGGYRIGGNKWKGSWYKDVWMDSSWELLFATSLDELGIVWKRDYAMRFEYEDKDGVTKKYHPDFYIPSIDKYVEIKGYWTDEARFKVQQVQKQVDILIFDSLELIKTFTEQHIK
jgi:predicted nuclease of restriction endonuclease-like RecB superfamily